MDLVASTNEITLRKESLSIVIPEPYKQTYDVYGNTGRSIPLERQFPCSIHAKSTIDSRLAATMIRDDYNLICRLSQAEN